MFPLTYQELKDDRESGMFQPGDGVVRCRQFGRPQSGRGPAEGTALRQTDVGHDRPLCAGGVRSGATGGARPGEGLHYVYGGIVLLAIPVAYVYSDQHQVRRDIIIMVIAVVAVVGAAVRALMTGQP